jgi:2-dehydropantoate 2-reductase
MRIAIVGAGGVGGYFGGRLAAAGSDVTFVARGAHLEAIRRDGLRIESPAGDLHLPHAKAVAGIDEIAASDIVFVAVKLWDTEAVAPTLRPLAEAGAAIVSWQNGVEKDEVLRRHLPADSVIGGVSYIASVIAGPGIVRHTGSMARLVFGEYGGAESARTRALLEDCRRAGIDAAISPDIERLIWEKFVFLVGLSGTTAAMRSTVGPIRENPATRAFLSDVMAEVVAVARAKGVALDPNFVSGRLAFVDTLLPAMAASMANDLERGNRLELPWLSGAVAAMGPALGVPTPLNRAIADILELYVPGRS